MSRLSFLLTLTWVVACQPPETLKNRDTAPTRDTSSTGGDDTAGDDTGPDPDPCAFSFAILTDLHLGEGLLDHGTPGWEDKAGDGGENAPVLALAVQEINERVLTDDLRFVVVLGDLSDSGERSELEAARAILDELTIPYLPLLGNHDAWPYVWEEDGERWDEAPSPSGDTVLWETFAGAFAEAELAFPSLRRAEPTWSPEIEADTWFVNFSFDFCGVHFLSLDTSTRHHTPTKAPGIGPEADINDIEGGTWPFLTSDLVEGPGSDASRIVVLSHHPWVAAGEYTFPEAQIDEVTSFFQDNSLQERIKVMFAGHVHMDAVIEGPLGIPVVLVAATRDGRPFRHVRVSETGEFDWSLAAPTIR